MNDTPEYIKEKQFEIWMAKTPEERLIQFCKDNDAMYRFWAAAKKQQMLGQQPGDISDPPLPYSHL